MDPLARDPHESTMNPLATDPMDPLATDPMDPLATDPYGSTG